MAYVCEICGKGRAVGNNVSHAHRKTKRTFNPNLKTVRALVDKAARHIKVCTRCIRSGWVKKAG